MRRHRALECVELEARALLSASALGLIAYEGTLVSPGATRTFTLPLTSDRFTPAASGKTLFEVEVTPSTGSAFRAGTFVIDGPTGKKMAVAEVRSGATMSGMVSLKPGDYTVHVAGRKNATGAFEVQAHLVGDVTGDGKVTQADITMIQNALGQRNTLGGGLPAGRITRSDLKLARKNLGAASNTISLQIANQTGLFTDSNVNISVYGKDPNQASAENPQGWVYFDNLGNEYPLTLGLSQVPSFPLSTVPLTGLPIQNATIVNSGEVYIGLGPSASVVLPVNTQIATPNAGATQPVTSFVVTNAGSGYTAAPTVTIEAGGGSGAAATATINVATGTITGLNLTSGGSGYLSAPLVTISGGGGVSATATATTNASGAVTGLTLVDPGNGFTSAPLVTITPGDGTGAAATASINASGQVTGVTITGGAYGNHYTSVPSVVFSGGGGTGAAATAVLNNTGIAAPSPSNPQDPNNNLYWDFGEFTLNYPSATSGINADVSQVDEVGFPLTLQLTSSTTGSTPLVGVYPARNSLISSFDSFVAPTSVTAATGTAVMTGAAGNESVSQVTLTSGGSGYTAAPTVYFVANGPGSGAAATATINSSGVVTGVTVTSGGSGYTSPPAVYLETNTSPFLALANDVGSGPDGTYRLLAPSDFVLQQPNTPLASYYNGYLSQFFTVGNTTDMQVAYPAPVPAAIATASISNGGVAALNITNYGLGYAVPPTVYLNGGGGSGAAATVTINPNGSIAGYTITNAGTGYTSAPTVSFSPGSGSGWVASSTLNGSGGVASVNITSGGTGFATPPIVTFSGGGGTGAVATATVSNGAVTSVTMINPGSGYTSAPTVAFTPALGFTGKVMSSNGTTFYQFTQQNPGSNAPLTFTVYSPLTPPSAGPYQPASQATFDVFANAGVFADNTYQEQTNLGLSTILGGIENQIVSAMNRGVALLPYNEWANPAQFYPAGGTANWYAAFLHQPSVSIGGLAYGFAFDDQGNNSTDLSVTNPTAITLTIGWNTALPTTPTTVVTPLSPAARHHSKRHD